MYSLRSISHARFSLLRCCDSLKWVSRFSSKSGGFPGSFNNSRGDSYSSENLAAGESPGKVGAPEMNRDSIKSNQNVSSQYPPSFQSFMNPAGFRKAETGRKSMNVMRGIIEKDSFQAGGDSAGSFNNSRGDSYPSANLAAQRSPGRVGAPEMNMGSINSNQSVFSNHPPSFQSFMNSRNFNEAETGRNSMSMNFVQGVLEKDGRNLMGFSPQARFNVEHNADFVHIKLLRNNTFVTVTDAKGNVKCRASSGCVPELKGGRYNAEATAEHVGRLAKKMGLKSVVMKVNGFTFFKKKKQAILSFRDGYTNSRVDQNPVVYIEDTTRRAHNGCRLRKKRRV